MYDPDRMDTEFHLVREAHDRNDEVLERIYIGTPKESLRDRRLKNDTVRSAFPQGKRLEKLFELYTKMTAQS